MATNEIKITVDTSTIALGMLDAEIRLASARVDVAAAAFQSLCSHRLDLLEQMEADETLTRGPSW